DLVGTHVFIGKLDVDLEFDRDQVVALHLTRPPGRDDRFGRRQALFPAERFACGTEDRRSFAAGRSRSWRCLWRLRFAGESPCKDGRADDETLEELARQTHVASLIVPLVVP